MSLNYSLKQCGVVSFEALTNEKDGSWQITEAIIFDSVAVGLGKLTEKNVQEWKLRSDLWRKMQVHKPLALIPLDELRKRIGLTTNVSDESWTAFVKRHAEGFKRDMQWSMR